MSDRRANPSRSACPRPQSLGDGEEDRARGTRARRTTNPPSSRAPALTNEGPRTCPDRSTNPCPPPLHRSVVRDSVAPGQIEVEGRAINPEVVHNSPMRIGQFTMNRVLQRPQNHCPRLHGPRTPGDCIPRRPIDYNF